MSRYTYPSQIILQNAKSNVSAIFSSKIFRNRRSLFLHNFQIKNFTKHSSLTFKKLIARGIFCLLFSNLMLFAGQTAPSVLPEDQEIAKLKEEEALLDQQISFYNTQNEKMKQIFSNPELEMAYYESVERDLKKLEILFNPESAHLEDQASALDDLEFEVSKSAAAYGHPLHSLSNQTSRKQSQNLGYQKNNQHSYTLPTNTHSQTFQNPQLLGSASNFQNDRFYGADHGKLDDPSLITGNNFQQLMESQPNIYNNQQMPTYQEQMGYPINNQPNMMYNQNALINPQQITQEETRNHPSFWSPISDDSDNTPRLLEYNKNKQSTPTNGNTDQEINANILRSMSGRSLDNDSTIESMQNAQRQGRGTSSNISINDIRTLRRR